MTAGIEPADVQLASGAAPAPAWTMRTPRLEVTATALGAHLVQVRVAGEERWTGISMDAPHVPSPGGFHGATAGRWANRIAGARFELDGVTHELEANEGANQLHGGPDGFDKRIWDLADLIDEPERAGVVLAMTSPHGDQGFPGRLAATVRYVVEDNRLEITYEATTDRPTVVNLTNHLYWNLGETGRLDGHRLTVAADRYVAVDDAGIPVPGPPVPVEGTRWDCRRARSLETIAAAGGFDHCFVVEPGTPGPHIRLDHVSGRSIAIETDQPGCQIYTGEKLDPDHRGIAIETQRIPDSPNRPDLGSAVLRPGERYRNRSIVTVDG